MAQALPAFADHFGLRVLPRVMLYLDANLYPAPEMLRDLAPRDAAALAELHGLDFPAGATPPDPERSLAVTRCLLKHEGDERFWSLAHALGQALWAGDDERLNQLLASHGQQPEDQARLALEARRDQFLADGHYLTATLHYQGEWYWSLERLDHLARRLEDLGLGGGPGRWTTAPPSTPAWTARRRRRAPAWRCTSRSAAPIPTWPWSGPTPWPTTMAWSWKYARCCPW